MPRLTRIYTRTGDDGTTGLGDGRRVSKQSLRIEAIGAIDELNSQLGVVRALLIPGDPVDDDLAVIQHRLFDLGGELAVPEQARVAPPWVGELEARLDALNAKLPPLEEFVLPGGNLPAAQCHLARAVCRRAERALVRLSDQEPVNSAALEYLNRLSDLLFVMARTLARREGGKEVTWQKGSNR
ncbi:MAG: cob(I)yrinic acid a,c-diamide adenosyltransferase [Gammaproteobacteria bacterium]|nr:MAG: cob(I)yrinic acid a,c-diamide adenosyltransferase [Gammaproteobacteria bacterium]